MCEIHPAALLQTGQTGTTYVDRDDGPRRWTDGSTDRRQDAERITPTDFGWEEVPANHPSWIFMDLHE